MKKNYPYLKDISFLNKIYGQHNKTVYSKITVLDWQERKIKEITGRIISGNLSVNGNSSVRRTANLSVKIFNNDELYQNPDSLFTINKKVFLEIGIKNNFRHLNLYSEYDTIWFPFGVFIIQEFSVNRDSSGVNLSLSLGDKMCLLNGVAGGTLPASTNFESYDTLGPDGDLHSEYIRINQIIPELVNHFGNEDLNNIIVNDIDDKIKQTIKWKSDNPLYLWQYTGAAGGSSAVNNVFYTTMNTSHSSLDIHDWSIRKIIYNYDAGYTYVDFVFPGELTGNAGDSVCTILDKIKETLGNYEYYYDIFGNFIFQEIKNYVNVSEWRTAFQNLKDNPRQSVYFPYAYNTRLNSSVYDFNNNDLIVSYSNNPQFNMVKNDFVVWGERQDVSGITLPCRYHLAIDNRPVLLEDLQVAYVNSESKRLLCFDTNVIDGIRRAFIIEDNGKNYGSLDELKADLPVGIVGKYYYIPGGKTSSVYTWVTDVDNYNQMLNNYLTSAGESPVSNITSTSQEVIADYIELPLATVYTDFTVSKNSDWRNILYFEDLIASMQGLNTSYYWAEMYNEWPKIYDIERDQWKQEVLDTPSSLDWWLDLIDNDSSITDLSVDNIGRRSYSVTDSKCNCVFEPDIPDVIMIDNTSLDTRSQMKESQLKELGLIPTQVPASIYNATAPGGTFNSCYQHVRQLLTNYTNYNENISVTTIPIYHLEPNTRVSFNDPKTGIYGEYIIDTLSFDLSGAGTMNISAKKVIEKI